MSNWYRVCCAVDFSETSRAALEEAADLARRAGAELTVIHVFEPPVGASGTVVPESALFEATRVELERKLELWRAEAEDLSGGAVRSRLVPGSAAQEVVRFAREGNFDLVVVGTHGRTGLRRLVLGSVAELVVREAGCPVLVVHPPKG
jgi:nucleotide-binding universal stress UspA family protein